MTAIKKSFNMEPDTAQQVDDFINKNPGVSATLIFNQAIKQWLSNPHMKLVPARATDDDINRFMEENKDLMSKLAK